MTDQAAPDDRNTDSYAGVASIYERAWTVPASIPLLNLFDRLLASHGPLVYPPRILELACGTGFLLRRARKALRPDYVVGVDISNDMITEARSIEAEASSMPDHSLAPIDFLVADCARSIAALAGQEDEFDFVMANFLFNYAKTEEEMARMWRNAARYLKPGGKFLATTQSFDAFPVSVRWNKYGMHVTACEGEDSSTDSIAAKQKLNFGWPGHFQVEFESFMITDQAIWERTAAVAGFEDLEFHKFGKEDVPLSVRTPEGEKGKDDMGYWSELIEHPFNLIMTARKAR
ncbi:mRNA cap guanine-N7 methyltransferase [Cyphellophora attinorum]|uniref:mRNA cap guanine-N7 methyltransferase n=1 Tax=Cyphellophora attinorum TaxID=1664694 RepID=A0A0N0NLL1_9EURO|nr:mRNA cap guanine-N7 methyltransferase [Phialophora attinorum]KPI39159.1 mRNA cap guanine-N7 methyltransferase [Phialophora attinorum]